MEQPTAMLQAAIDNYIAAGYRITSQTPTSAQLVRPKQFSCLLATISFLLFGIGVVIYLFYFASLRDDVTYLHVDQSGQVQARHQDTNQGKALLVAGAAFLVIFGCFGFFMVTFLLGAVNGPNG